MFCIFIEKPMKPYYKFYIINAGIKKNFIQVCTSYSLSFFHPSAIVYFSPLLGYTTNGTKSVEFSVLIPFNKELFLENNHAFAFGNSFNNSINALASSLQVYSEASCNAAPYGPQDPAINGLGLVSTAFLAYSTAFNSQTASGVVAKKRAVHNGSPSILSPTCNANCVEIPPSNTFMSHIVSVTLYKERSYIHAVQNRNGLENGGEKFLYFYINESVLPNNYTIKFHQTSSNNVLYLFDKLILTFLIAFNTDHNIYFLNFDCASQVFLTNKIVRSINNRTSFLKNSKTFFYYGVRLSHLFSEFSIINYPISSSLPRITSLIIFDDGKKGSLPTFSAAFNSIARRNGACNP
ncbi:hypothetical protein V1477_011175 [Vespula maculifrons]|uniref:Uncharacterized protein n=1 Tax=Vespula maculifrons TaxID=7453 RepID=A0ABD2C422_VESMC